MEHWGEPLVRVPTRLQPFCSVARHYASHFATSPATSRSGEEPSVLYQSVAGKMPVLMGLFGSRRRNEILLHGTPGDGARRLAQQLNMRLPCETVGNAVCHEVVCSDGLNTLPVLTATRLDAGPYLTSGLICARDLDSGAINVSIHRLRVLDANHLTIWMLPGRDLDRMWRRAAQLGKSLPISINIGVPPVVYLVSSISAPFLKRDESELELAGAVQGYPVQISRCITHDGICISRSEIVVECEITQTNVDEFSDPVARWAMPEFLGYMGNGRAQLPLVKVSQVSHRREPIYQTFLGPGKEQSELLALPTEAGILARLSTAFAGEFSVLDAHYLAPSGGQLMLALRIKKHVENSDGMSRLRDALIDCHQLTKGILVVDEDVDIHSTEDVMWAMSTRFQPSRDLYVREKQTGFQLDPSQHPGYLDHAAPMTDKYLMDLTVPLDMRDKFKRWGAALHSNIA
jgi:gallate decarboxylase subunit C